MIDNNNSALVTDAWIAQGNTQFDSWTRDFVPFSVVKKPFSYAQKIFSKKVLGVALAPELGNNRLKFGYVNTDPVADSTVAPDCPNGICSFP